MGSYHRVMMGIIRDASQPLCLSARQRQLIPARLAVHDTTDDVHRVGAHLLNKAMGISEHFAIMFFLLTKWKSFFFLMKKLYKVKSFGFIRRP